MDVGGRLRSLGLEARDGGLTSLLDDRIRGSELADARRHS